MSATIEIKTDRLVLRPVAPEHCDRFVAGLNEWDVVKNLSHPPYPYAVADFDAFQAKQAKGFGAGTDLAFAIHVAGTEAIGCVGLHRRDDGADAEGSWEMGYWLAKSYWGRGFATEAGEALLQWFTARHPGERIKASHFEDNDTSGRVLTKLGFAYTGEILTIQCVARGVPVQSRAMTYAPKTTAPTWEERP